MPADAGELRSTIAALNNLSKAELGERVRALYGIAPLRYMRREMLLRLVAHRTQEKAQGGPDPVLRRRLAKLADELRRTGRVAIATRPPVKPGTRLLRQWQGETHSVTVTEDGFIYRGERFRSLSVIARAITGTRWSGPAFFGLKGRRSQ